MRAVDVLRRGVAAGSVIVLGTGLCACGLLFASEGFSGGDDGEEPTPAGDAAVATDVGSPSPSPGADAGTGNDASTTARDGCPPPGDGVCDGGSTWRGRCYWTVPNTRETDAVAACAQGGGYLVTTTCQDEWRFVRNLVSVEDAFVGARLAGETWTWRTGEPFAFDAWSSGHPLATTDGGFPCANIDKSSLRLENDVACHATRTLVCERGDLASR